MKRKILSLILVLILVLCQGNFCLDTVFASDVIDPDKPDEDAVIIERSAWSLEFENPSDIDNFFPSNRTELEISHVHGDYMQYTTHSTYINSNGNKAGYFADYRFPAGEELDMDKYYTMQIRMKVVDVDVKAPYKLYIAGTNEDGSTLKMAEKNFDTYSYNYTSSNGVYSTDWFVLNIDLSSSEHWVNGKTLSQFRANFIHNAAGTVLVDYIRFIETPGIRKITFNNGTEADIGDVPVNPETIEICLSDYIEAVPDNAVELRDNDGNDVILSDVKLSGGNMIKLTLGQELNMSTAYTLILNENVRITGNINLPSPLPIEFTTSDYRIPTILDVIDPERPSDEVPDGYDNVWSLDFKDETDLKHFSPSSRTEIELQQVYGEYLQYTTKSTYKNSNDKVAGYFADYNFSPALDTGKFFKLQIRMKVLEVKDSTCFRLYMKTASSDGTINNMSESDLADIAYDLKPIDKYYTDENGEQKQYSGTDWFVLEIDLSSNEKWVDAKTLQSFRPNVVHNAAGVVLVDYIRFLGYSPTATNFAYNLDGKTTEITDDTYVPALTNTFTVGLSHPISGISLNNVSLTSNLGTKIAVTSARLDIETKQIITVTTSSPLDKSAVYTLFINPYISGSLIVSEPIAIEFKTELEPISFVVDKGERYAAIDYRNATDKDIVLAAIATIVEDDVYVGKKIIITPLASGASVDNVILDYSQYVSDTTSVEIAIWKCDTTSGKLSVQSKIIY